MRPLTPLNIPPKTGVVVEVLVPEALVEDERGGFCAFLAPLPCVFVSSDFFTKLMAGQAMATHLEKTRKIKSIVDSGSRSFGLPRIWLVLESS